MSEDDEQYQKATKAVDDAMRTDILGAKVCKVLNEHLPTNKLLEEKVVDFIHNSSTVKEAIGNEVNNNQSVRMGKWVERAVLVVGSGVVYWLGQLLIEKFTKP